MALTTQQVQSNRVKRCSITIPANASAAVTLESLCLAATYTGGAKVLQPQDLPYIIGGAITVLPAAAIVGDNATDLPHTLAILTSPSIHTEPAVNYLANTFIKAAAGGTIAAVVSVYLAGDGFPGIGA